MRTRANSSTVTEDGRVKCISCRKDFRISDVVDCIRCDRFVCTSCATYRKQGDPYGYVCKSCKIKLS